MVVNRQQLIECLRTEPHHWLPGGAATAERYQFYLRAAAEIERLELMLERAKTAALIDVAESAAARGDWSTAQTVLRYRIEDVGSIPDLDPAAIIKFEESP